VYPKQGTLLLPPMAINMMLFSNTCNRKKRYFDFKFAAFLVVLLCRLDMDIDVS
jgi:hypothetical protein